MPKPTGRTINIQIKNIKEIKAAFAQAPRIMTRELNRAIPSALITIERQSRINTPVDTGYLIASHYTQFANLRGTLALRANYAFWVHDGTKYMRARPFLENAVKSEDAKVQSYFRIAVQNTLDQIGRMT